ncbi:DUF397 domain-containing protein [Streptomyces sp. NPDC101219]|uniref:DUF397 domain-containing protein n=1 Tax=Streptomyces sp. NPDC101219 TaxID=3366131 RepID=UPI0038021DB7
MTTLDWKRSPFCGGGDNNCVEVAVNDEDDDIAIRDSTRPEHIVRVSRSTFTRLVTRLRASAPN